MAQTTRLASFGPVLIIVGLPVAYFVYYNVYTMKYKLVLEKKHKIKKIKNSPMAQTMPDTLFGPVLFISILPAE